MQSVDDGMSVSELRALVRVSKSSEGMDTLVGVATSVLPSFRSWLGRCCTELKNTDTQDVGVLKEGNMWLNLYRNLVTLPEHQDVMANAGFYDLLNQLMDALLFCTAVPAVEEGNDVDSKDKDETSDMFRCYASVLLESSLLVWTNMCVNHPDNQQLALTMMSSPNGALLLRESDDSVFALACGLLYNCTVAHSCPPKLVAAVLSRETGLTLSSLREMHPHRDVERPYKGGKVQEEDVDEEEESESLVWVVRLLTREVGSLPKVLDALTDADDALEVHLFVAYMLADMTADAIKKTSEAISQTAAMHALHCVLTHAVVRLWPMEKMCEEMKSTGGKIDVEVLFPVAATLQLVLGCCADLLSHWHDLSSMSPEQEQDVSSMLTVLHEQDTLRAALVLFNLCENPHAFADVLPEPQTEHGEDADPSQADVAAYMAAHSGKKPEAVAGSPYCMKTTLLQFIATCSFKRAGWAERVGELGLLPHVLNCSRYDDNNPWSREWSVFAVRNLTETSTGNVARLKELQLQGIANQDELKKMGVKADYDRKTGRVTVSSSRPPPLGQRFATTPTTTPHQPVATVSEHVTDEELVELEAAHNVHTVQL